MHCISQLPKLTQLELQYVSPKLLMCRDLELAVPGSYVPNREVIRIGQVEQSLQVMKDELIMIMKQIYSTENFPR